MIDTKDIFPKNHDELIKTGETSRKGGISDWHEYLEKAKIDYNFRNAIGDELTKVSYNEFFFVKTLGVGAFGRVMLSQHKSTGKYYAAKLMKKEFIVRTKQVRHAYNEKNILKSIRFPFTVNLEYFFQDNVYLYFVLPLVEGGELFIHLHKKGKFDEHLARFYAAQVLLALEYLHYLDLIYRDLKPENLLLDAQGYVKVTDFGFCKYVVNRTYTLCGTPEYMAPEIINSKGYGRSADYWAFGILLYELNSGQTPFYAPSQMKIFERITNGRYKNQPFFSTDLKDLVKHTLETDLSKRYGILKRGIDDIKSHKWFAKIIWLSLLNKYVKAPFIPQIQGPGDLTFFEQVLEEPLAKGMTDPYEKEFANF